MKSYHYNLLNFIIISFIFVSCSEERTSSFDAMAVPLETATTDTAVNEERVVIKTANIAMAVTKVEESVQTFQTLVNQMRGHVFHYEIQNDKQYKNEVKHNLDSSMIINEIHPSGLMKVKIPVAYGDSFISAVLKMNGRIDHFMFDENDITEDLTEKREYMQSDASIVQQNKQQDEKMKKPKEGDAVYLAKELSDSYIKRKADYMTTNYQTKYLWFDIKLQGNKYTSNQMIATSTNVRTPFYVSALDALSNGWYGFSIFLTLILGIWPFILLTALVWVAIRKKWFRRIFNFS